MCWDDVSVKVFVSWSGELSQKYAQILKDWLEQCIQSVEVFFSSEDIEKGDNWQTKLSSELKDANYGIVCLTPENIDAPWIHFEAGALSKMLDARVMVLAININFSDIRGPLKAFQATKIEKDDIFKLLKSINNAQERPLGEDKLKNSFDAFWPQFISKTDAIKKQIGKNNEEKKISNKVNVSDTVDEILQLVRSQNAIINDPEKVLPAEYLEYVLRRIGYSGKSDDRIFDEIYSFTDYLFSVYPILSTDRGDYYAIFNDYQQMIKRICTDNPMWKKRFSSLFSRIRMHNARREDESRLGNMTD